jgi:RNA polymerase sigma-70 factor (ECF subfamily)
VRDAFAALYDRYEPRIYAFIYSMTGDTDDATDLTRETFLRAYRLLDGSAIGCGAEPNANVWLHRLAADACLTARRRSGRWARRGAGEHRRPAANRDDDPRRGPPATATACATRNTLARMVPRHRLALVLRDYAGLSTGEVGAVLGISAAEARILLFRAREAFRALQDRPSSPP